MGILTRPFTALTSRQVDALLAWLITAALVTGLASWAFGTGWSRVITVSHSLVGFGLLVLTPLKLRGSVRRGFRRRRSTRWVSAAMGMLVVATVAVGVAHTTGLWYGVGFWSALWTHQLLAFALVPLVLWHVTSRPAGPKRTDLDRRTLVGGAATIAAAGAVFGAQEVVVRATPLAGGDRRFTGSHEIASFDPANMPTVSWLNDSRPRTPLEDWRVNVAGKALDPIELWDAAVPLEAVLDCTGGWWSRQRWDVVPIAALLGNVDTRSFRVTSSTGYSRLFPAGDADTTYVAVGYGGEPLRRGHGAPARIVAPGRRGPWWIKWVTDIEPTDRFWWAQFPFPLS